MGGGDMAVLEDKEGEIRPWSDTPELALSKIQSRLYGRDAAAFSGVCKAWKSLPPLVREEDLALSPCLYLPNNRFFHPLRNLFFPSETVATFPEGVIIAQNCNWLLVVLLYYPPFFFNPSTNQIIDLPYFPCNPLSAPTTFTAPPTSPDCELFTLSERYVNGEHVIVIKTMKRGEDGFHTKHTMRTLGRFELSKCRIVFYRGEYYCMGKEGNMVVYNSKKNKGRLTGSPKYLWRHFSASDCSHYMFEGEGDLWAVFVACQGRQVCVFKLQWARMIWEKVHDLEDRMVFVSRNVSFMERSKVRGAGNKIYFPRLRDKKCLFYCLATKRYYTQEGSNASYQSFHESEEMVPCTWIKMDIDPLPSQTCDKELVW